MTQYYPFFWSIVPIVVLIWMMTKKKSVPSYIALPIVALFVYFIQLIYFESDPTLVGASMIRGGLATITPISIVAGAILFNRFQQLSGCENLIRKWLSNITPNPVGQMMIVGWAFAFMVEGASGFGTPAAIAAPILMGLGFPALGAAMVVLVMNSVPVSFGAVGTPTWFGLGNPLHLDESMILAISSQTAVIHAFAALVIPVIALKFVFDWKTIRKNILFVYISIAACVVPYLILAQFNYEFPALVAGAIGLFLSIIVAEKDIGLEKIEGHEPHHLPFRDVLKALSPTLILIVILIVTRIHQLGLKGLMTSKVEWISTVLGHFGTFEVTQGLVISLKDIFGQVGQSESYALLYTPALIPFFLTVVLLLSFYPMKGKVKVMFEDTWGQVKKPFFSLVGALIMIKMMNISTPEQASMLQIIGNTFAETIKSYWGIFASYLGALGAFFSGSNTVSNITFGGIQQTIAEQTNLPVVTILALQSVGGAMGNMTCINNIIAVSAVTGLEKKEGYIIKRTAVPMFIYGVIAALVAYLLYLH